VDYNPRSPQNIGMEWVPIKQADFLPDNFDEYGYIMRLDHSATVVSGSIGLNAVPAPLIANTMEGVSVYPEITAYDTGPVRKVTIPVQSGSITGSNIVAIGGTVAQCLSNPSDTLFVSWLSSATDSDVLGLNFNTTAYANELSGKRIVKMRLAYTLGGETLNTLDALEIGIARKAAYSESFFWQQGAEGGTSNGSLTTSLAFVDQINYIDLGDWNPVWGPGVSTFVGGTIFPWRYQELANLDTAAAINIQQQIVLTANLFDGTVSVGTMNIGYMALEIFYCEETRVAYGGYREMSIALATNPSLQIGENRVPLRDTSYALGKVLTPGTYLVTATHRPVSNFNAGKSPPTYAAIQQLNEDWPVEGRVFKPTIVVDTSFSVEETDVINDVTLLTAVAAVTGCHGYANQIGAPVYGAITATQDIHVRQEISTTAFYTQVRYYARRFENTTVPLKVTIGSATASITVDDFNDLDEIINGWREVTLDLTGSVAVSGDSVQTVVWSAVGETAGNQWQVLGAQMYITTPNLNVMSYDPPGGATTELTWKGPNQTSSTVDSLSDATVVLAQSLPAPTSFTLGVATQAVTGVATECSLPPNCIPTGIKYVNLTWDMPIACDQFERTTTTAEEFGTSSSGDAWSLDTGLSNTAYVDGERGVITFNAVNDFYTTLIAVGNANQRAYAEFSVDALAIGSSITARLLARVTDSANYYTATVVLGTGGTFTLQVSKRVAGVGTLLTVTNVIGQYGANSKIAVMLQAVGTWVYGAAWNIDSTPPSSWQVVFQDTTSPPPLGTLAGMQGRLETGNTNTLPVTMYMDNFYAADVRYTNATLEIQRQDDEDGNDWQTILQAQNYCFTSMKDFEARVGMESRYRARFLDSLAFAGPWVTGAATLTSPGVTGSGSNTGESILIFTSNQAPGSNLAYPMVWEGQPIEMFAFPEADTQVMLKMYGRDFQVAFRPLERGGEMFDRVMLVQAAAIPVPSLANFHSLRDLAWADLPYVCVRDELGNRWYANVLVPSGTVNNKRRLYLAQIRVTEVADEAAPVTS